ncbi:transcriptional regulator CynR [Streptomyces sp. VRA16 Mangrove soil]|uniref:transcriptional regulator CynR n=1 Tax=Streptomyces sp. VRA16 Mangrove soil TaxID=2817434 RepID=UPI001A9D3966|nr:transcriptional regulator CynR [Streptomyces sp. VRA16 Mangrove soil]MBO1332715.1 transcriptional regulator CynR [Streptomyces sp. VRA16 Mangrove soil]
MATPELRHLRYLLAVTEHGSFTRAAEHLHISQPTLSQQLRQLERMAGAQLLDRSGRTVRPTDAGAVYVEHARRALRELAAAERALADVHDLSRGRLRLGVTPTFTAYLVGPVLATLHDRHPGLALTVTETAQQHIEAALLSDDLDAGIGFTGGPVASGIAVEPLYTERLGLVVRAGAHEERLAVDQLAERELALLSDDFATRSWIDDYFAAHGVAARIAVEADSALALIEMVRAGGLATLLPDVVTHRRPELASVQLVPPPPARTAALLRREGGYVSAAAAAFLGLLRAHVTEHGWPPGS